MMTRLRVAAAVLATTALIMTMAVPVAAKGKPPKPSDPPPVLMDVTMTGALTTECNDGDEIDDVMVMERNDHGLAPANLARLALDIPDVDSSRLYHPKAVTASGFAGCHGEQLDGTTSPYGGLFITLDDTEAVTDLLWHFDYYLETTTRGKRTVMSLMEHFTLSGHDLMWDAKTSMVSGWFNVLYHLEDRVNHVSVGYEPVDGSPVFLKFTLMMMTPHS